MLTCAVGVASPRGRIGSAAGGGSERGPRDGILLGGRGLTGVFGLLGGASI